MKSNFDKIRTVLKTGFWQLTRNLVTGDAMMDVDDVAKNIFEVPDGIDAKEVFKYWESHVVKEDREALSDFFDRANAEDGMLESVYLLKCPGSCEKYIRVKGQVSDKTDKYIIVLGSCEDITDLRSRQRITDRNVINKMLYDAHNETSSVIEALGTIVEFRNMESSSHIRCVKEFTEILANYVSEHYPEYGITRTVARSIAAASPLHDIGKIAISDMVLLKPGRLTRAEFEMMQTHSQRGYEIIQSLTMLNGSYKRFAGEIALSHHERYDGRGYPSGLKGDRIPISAQIVSLADVYDALITPRIYKDAYTPKQAYNMIISGECGVFNPKLLKAFEYVRDDFEKIAKRYKTDEFI